MSRFVEYRCTPCDLTFDAQHGLDNHLQRFCPTSNPNRRKRQPAADTSNIPKAVEIKIEATPQRSLTSDAPPRPENAPPLTMESAWQAPVVVQTTMKQIILLFDFVTGLPKTGGAVSVKGWNGTVRLHYALHAADGTLLGESSIIPNVEIEKTTGVGFVNARREMSLAAFRQGVKMITQVLLQTFDMQNVLYAWTMMELVNRHGDITTGTWSVPLLLPPVTPDVLINQIDTTAVRLQDQSQMYVRVAKPTNTEIIDAVVSIDNLMMTGHTPSYYKDRPAPLARVATFRQIPKSPTVPPPPPSSDQQQLAQLQEMFDSQMKAQQREIAGLKAILMMKKAVPKKSPPSAFPSSPLMSTTNGLPPPPPPPPPQAELNAMLRLAALRTPEPEVKKKEVFPCVDSGRYAIRMVAAESLFSVLGPTEEDVTIRVRLLLCRRASGYADWTEWGEWSPGSFSSRPLHRNGAATWAGDPVTEGFFKPMCDSDLFHHMKIVLELRCRDGGLGAWCEYDVPMPMRDPPQESVVRLRRPPVEVSTDIGGGGKREVRGVTEAIAIFMLYKKGWGGQGGGAPMAGSVEYNSQHTSTFYNDTRISSAQNGTPIPAIPPAEEPPPPFVTFEDIDPRRGFFQCVQPKASKIPKELWVDVKLTHLPRQHAARTEGFRGPFVVVVVLDALRNVPMNVACTRGHIVIKEKKSPPDEKYKKDKSEVHRTQDLTSFNVSPIFTNFYAVAKEESVLASPECHAIITFDVIDLKKTRHVLGHIFLDDLGKERSEEVHLMYGTYDSGSTVLKKQFPFPLTTVLIRVMILPESKLTDETVSLPVTKSPYLDGFYDTQQTEPSSGDIRMFTSISNIPKILCNKVIPEEKITEILGVNPGIPNTLLDTSYVSQYDGASGFVINLEGIYGIRPDREAVIKVVAEISPPSHFSLKNPELRHVFATLQHDTESDIVSPQFLDPPFAISNFAFFPHAVIFLHVYRVRRSKPKEFEAIAFGCFQLFRPPAFLHNGRVSVPLYEGALPRQLVNELITSPITKIIPQWIARKTFAVVPMRKSCVYMSVYDSRRSPIAHGGAFRAPDLPMYISTGFDISGQYTNTCPFTPSASDRKAVGFQAMKVAFAFYQNDIPLDVVEGMNKDFIAGVMPTYKKPLEYVQPVYGSKPEGS